MDHKMNLAINLFNTYIKQNKGNRNFKVFDALHLASKDAEVNIFELSKELELTYCLKKD